MNSSTPQPETESEAAATPARGPHRRIWFLYIAIGLTILTPFVLRLATLGGKPEILLRIANGAAVDSKDADAAIHKVALIYKNSQFTILYVCYVALFLFYYKFLWVLFQLCRTCLVTFVIGFELLLLLWMVHGGLSSMGIPGLFWNADPGDELRAGMGVSLFVFWMLYMAYGRNYDRHRREDEWLIWDRLRPALEESGLPAFFNSTTEDVSSVGQLRWFLSSIGLPILLMLTLLAVLPATRPGDTERLIAWPWLVGLLIGTLMVASVVWSRAPTRIYALWTQFVSGKLDVQPLINLTLTKLDPNVNIKNILLIVLGAFLSSYVLPRRFMIWLFPPAFSICVLLGITATFMVWAAAWRVRVRLVVLFGVLGLIAWSGGLDYEVVLRDLAGWYPRSTDQLRHQFGTPTSQLASYARVKSLRAYQKQSAEEKREARMDAREEREQVLDRWAHGIEATKATPGKPVLVVVTTSGGALRAGLWTESVLRHLENAMPGFSRRIRLITGASGGMLGAALYVSLLAEDKLPGPESQANVLGSDYLTPIAWQIAFRDFIPNAFCPFATYNRADALEDAWCATSPGLKRPFAYYRDKEATGEIPSIIFSPMMVEDGRRLLISNLPLADLAGNPGYVLIRDDRERLRQAFLDQQPDDQPKIEPDDHDLEYPDLASVSAVEMFKLLGEDARKSLSLASAVRMSATFPYVTSAATLPTEPTRHVVDAGYYDNYGVNLAAAWIASHREWLRDHTSGVLIVQIRAFRNEKRLKLLDEDIHSIPTPPKEGRLSRWVERAETVVRFFPESVSLVAEGIQSWMIPVMGIAKARESSMFFRNDEQLIELQRTLFSLTGDDDFFRSVIFTCDTIHVGQSAQNVETLNWYIDPDERDQIWFNMDEVNPTTRTGRTRNHLRLKALAEWWDRRQGVTPNTTKKALAEDKPAGK